MATSPVTDSQITTTDQEPVSPLRRFRPGAYGAMVEDDNGLYVRHDELVAWLSALESQLRAYEQKGRVS